MAKNYQNIIVMYWKAYGGFRAFWCSGYFLIPLLITLFCTKHWLGNSEWMSDPIAILPSLLGFTLAGYAMWLSTGNEKLKTVLSKKFNLKENEYSVFMQINASFIHFVMFQIFALIFILFLKYNSLDYFANKVESFFDNSNVLLLCFDFTKNLFNALGFFLFIYSIFTMLTTVLGIFRISFWIDSQNRLEPKAEYILCPECYGEVLKKAKRCKHCACEFEIINDSNKPS